MNEKIRSNQFRVGTIAILGRPNVGKSTLLNCIVGQKISITTHKPQTTRQRILGIKTTAEAQYIYVDTPGFHLGGKRALNRHMNREVLSALKDIDIVLLLLWAKRWTDEDQALLEKLKSLSIPVIAVINKVDELADKKELLPVIGEVMQKYAFTEIVPVSAKTGSGIDRLEKIVREKLPYGQAIYDEDQVTDKSMRYLAAEIIREKLFLRVQEEIPYSLSVGIEIFEEHDTICNISAVIWVEKTGHKAIVIGKQGAMLKAVGEEARKSMEKLFEKKVFLKLWVKVKEGWADDERILKSLGFGDDL